MDKKPSFWNFGGNRQEYWKALKEQIIRRAEAHRKNGSLEKAISCCEGFLNHYNTDQQLHNYIGSLYLESGDVLKAGRHFYFKPDLTPEEEVCVRTFEKQFGNDPLLIAKKLIYKERFRISELDDFAKRKLSALVEAAIVRVGTVPRFLKAPKQYFDKWNLNKTNWEYRYEELVELIENHHFEQVKHWLVNGGDPDLGIDAGQTALVLQVAYELFETGDQQEVLTLLETFLKQGASINPASQIKPGELLYEALASGNREAVRLLMEYGSDCNIIFDTDYPCETPLIYAVEKNDVALVELILPQTSPELLHFVGGYTVASALGIAFKNTDEKLVRLLLEAGANPYFREWDHLNNYSKDLIPTGCSIEQRERLNKLVSMHSLYSE